MNSVFPHESVWAGSWILLRYDSYTFDFFFMKKWGQKFPHSSLVKALHNWSSWKHCLHLLTPPPQIIHSSPLPYFGAFQNISSNRLYGEIPWTLFCIYCNILYHKLLCLSWNSSIRVCDTTFPCGLLILNLVFLREVPFSVFPLNARIPHGSVLASLRNLHRCL